MYEKYSMECKIMLVSLRKSQPCAIYLFKLSLVISPAIHTTRFLQQYVIYHHCVIIHPSHITTKFNDNVLYSQFQCLNIYKSKVVGHMIITPPVIFLVFYINCMWQNNYIIWIRFIYGSMDLVERLWWYNITFETTSDVSG